MPPILTRCRESFCSWDAECPSVQSSDGIAKCAHATELHIQKQRHFKQTLSIKIILILKVFFVKQRCDRSRSSFVGYPEICLQHRTINLRVTLADYFAALKNFAHILLHIPVYSNSDSKLSWLHIGTVLAINCYIARVFVSRYLEWCLCLYSIFWCIGSLFCDETLHRRQAKPLYPRSSNWDCSLYAYDSYTLSIKLTLRTCARKQMSPVLYDVAYEAKCARGYDSCPSYTSCCLQIYIYFSSTTAAHVLKKFHNDQLLLLIVPTDAKNNKIFYIEHGVHVLVIGLSLKSAHISSHYEYHLKWIKLFHRLYFLFCGQSR